MSAALAVSLLFALCAAAQTTQPATQPTDVRTLVAQLNDRQAATRDAAEQELMSLPFADLAKLQAVVTESRPIFPNQAALLRDVVTQIVLAHKTYAADPEHAAFLGISFPPPLVEFDQGQDKSVRVIARYAGFSSFQMLRDGDVIIGLPAHPEWALDRGSFKEIIHKYKPGDSVDLTVDRQGRTLALHCLLRAWPADFGQQQGVDDWQAQRFAFADQYWQDHFAALVGNDAS